MITKWVKYNAPVTQRKRVPRQATSSLCGCRGTLCAPGKWPGYTEGVNEYCTCGAKLPEDARFCHKCGKPQRDEPLIIEEQPQVIAPPPISVIPAPPPIGLKNGQAVRIALASCALSSVLLIISGQLGMPPVISLLWFVGAGFFAVMVYRKRTGQHLSAMSGARLGWISGLFTFVLVTIVLTIIAIALSEPAGVAAIREQWRAQHRPEEDLNQILEMLRSPVGIAAGLLGSFFFLTSLPAFGGAICAKFFDRD